MKTETLTSKLLVSPEKHTILEEKIPNSSMAFKVYIHLSNIC